SSSILIWIGLRAYKQDVMIFGNIWKSSAVVVLVLSPLRMDAQPSVPGVGIVNLNWAIIMTPEGYSDVAVDNRPGFEGREYLSREWAAAVFYTGGAQ
ncbi:hypothetical protein, partial [Haloferula sp.]|uniref:hypothetical protein n=1 Tax=Haloferula sp. TaxID=2497595 RepID=UPI003C746E9C